MRIKILCKTDFVELRKMIDEVNGVNGYIYSHETRCKGRIVSILPFRRTKDNKFEFLLRNEVTPPWGMETVVSSITGGIEDEYSIEENATKELFEEAGYEVVVPSLISLGTCRGTKSSDTIYHLFSTDLTNIRKTGSASGDGSELEKKANCEWKRIPEGEDPLIHVMYLRLIRKLNKISNEGAI